MARVPIGKRDKDLSRSIVLRGTVSYGAFIEGGFGITDPPQEPPGRSQIHDTIYQEGITAVSLIPLRFDRFILKQIDLLSVLFLCLISREKDHTGAFASRSQCFSIPYESFRPASIRFVLLLLCIIITADTAHTLNVRLNIFLYEWIRPNARVKLRNTVSYYREISAVFPEDHQSTIPCSSTYRTVRIPSLQLPLMEEAKARADRRCKVNTRRA